MQRCGWVTQDPLYLAYHDEEWGVPQTDGKKLFEMICLEGQQAGLSWITVLKNAKTTVMPSISSILKKWPRWAG
jgi:3-methyladenine DNA glycosylase Tag